jgi:acetyltransferase-like isoleucine patch superfamily enzyme
MSENKVKPQRSLVDDDGGPVEKYKKRVVGSKSILYFITYESITTLFCNCPGAAGLFFRMLFYPFLIGKCGKGVQFGRGVTLRSPLKISIGPKTFIDDYSVLDCKSEYDPGISIGEKCLIARNTKLSTGYTGYVRIGSHTIIGENCIVHGPGGIEIGTNVLIGDSVLINAGKHVYDAPDKTILSQGITTKGIKIGDDVWLGTGVIITDGVTIGKGCVVEAGSVVSESLPEYSVASGFPARVTGSRR